MAQFLLPLASLGTNCCHIESISLRKLNGALEREKGDASMEESSAWENCNPVPISFHLRAWGRNCSHKLATSLSDNGTAKEYHIAINCIHGLTTHFWLQLRTMKKFMLQVAANPQRLSRPIASNTWTQRLYVQVVVRYTCQDPLIEIVADSKIYTHLLVVCDAALALCTEIPADLAEPAHTKWHVISLSEFIYLIVIRDDMHAFRPERKCNFFCVSPCFYLALQHFGSCL